MSRVTHGATSDAERTDCGKAVARLIDPWTSDPAKITCKLCRKAPRLAGSGVAVGRMTTLDEPARSIRRLVVLESPYAGNVVRNLAYARAAMRDSLARGESPIASHLLWAASGVLDDADEAERASGIEAGLAWAERAAATVVYSDLGISRGMQQGIAHAQAYGRPVEHRSLPGWSETVVIQDGAPEKNEGNG